MSGVLAYRGQRLPHPLLKPLMVYFDLLLLVIHPIPMQPKIPRKVTPAPSLKLTGS
jgi:hypothetical protein